MEGAPPFNCWSCGRRIGKATSHWLMPGVLGEVWCGRCVSKHNRWGKEQMIGSRAAIANVLGRWP